MKPTDTDAEAAAATKRYFYEQPIQATDSKPRTGLWRRLRTAWRAAMRELADN